MMALVFRIFDSEGSNRSSLENIPHEIRNTRGKLKRTAQRAWYPQEYLRLSDGEKTLERQLLNLKAFLDKDGIIKVGGILTNAVYVRYSEGFPIDRSCRFSHLLIDFIHRLTLHWRKPVGAPSLENGILLAQV